MLALIDFDEMRAVLNLEKPDLADYPSLEAIVASVYAAIESHTGRTLERASRTEYVDVDGRIVPLKALPVQSVSLVMFDGADMTADLVVSRRDGLRIRYPLTGEVAVTYTGGLSLADVQNASEVAALKRAMTLQVLHEFQRKDHIGAESVSNEGGFTRWPQMGLLDEVKRLLAPIRNPTVMI